jgi:hypothetical protein
MGDDVKFRHGPALFGGGHEGLDHRREIGTGIGKDMFNASFQQGVQKQARVGPGNDVWFAQQTLHSWLK